MPAALREGPRAAQQPRAKAPLNNTTAKRAPAKPQAAAKLHAANRVGLPPKVAVGAAGGLMLLGLIIALGTGHRAQIMGQSMSRGAASVMADAGFRLKTVHIQGATAMSKDDILRAAGAPKGTPMFDLDLNALRTRVQSVGWVQEVKVVRLLPDTLVVAVKQRRPVAVWQHAGRSAMIDDAGRVIVEADPSRFPSLPLVVGAGADQAATSILNELSQRPPLMGRIEALVRVDDRRWDLRLKDGTLVQLPAIDEEAALIRLDQLEQKQGILDLGLARIDLRNSEFLAVRPRDAVQPAADGV